MGGGGVCSALSHPKPSTLNHAAVALPLNPNFYRGLSRKAYVAAVSGGS